MLLGGVDENDEHRERSLAKLYNELLDLQLENLKDRSWDHWRFEYLLERVGLWSSLAALDITSYPTFSDYSPKVG